MTDPTGRPALDIPAIVHCLAEFDVQWVLTGSAVLTAYGAPLSPNDLDVTPELSPSNLDRLARSLESLEAVPAFMPEWADGPSLDTCQRWRPHPATEQHLDHLFVTKLGMVDIVPRLCGTFDTLINRATAASLDAAPLLVSHPSDVLVLVADRDRPKDRQRRQAYNELALQIARGTATLDLDRFVRTGADNPTPTGI